MMKMHVQNCVRDLDYERNDFLCLMLVVIDVHCHWTPLSLLGFRSSDCEDENFLCSTLK